MDDATDGRAEPTPIFHRVAEEVRAALFGSSELEPGGVGRDGGPADEPSVSVR